MALTPSGRYTRKRTPGSEEKMNSNVMPKANTNPNLKKSAKVTLPGGTTVAKTTEPKGNVAGPPGTTLGAPPKFATGTGGGTEAPPVVQSTATLPAGAQSVPAAANPATPNYGSSQYGSKGTDPVGGFFGQNYLSGMWPTLYEQPGIVMEDVLKSMGMGNPMLAAQMGNATQYAPTLAELMASITGNYSAEGLVNTMADYSKQLATKGGRLPDARELMPGILNPAAGSDMYDLLNQVDPNTGLRITAAEQMNLMQPYIQAANSATTPLHQRAIMAAMERALADLQGGMARGNVPAETSAMEYLRKNNLY